MFGIIQLTAFKSDRRTSIPVYTIAFSILVCWLFSFILFGSTVAFSNIVNLSAVRLYSSYLICTSLLLWRRLQLGKIRRRNSRMEKIDPGNLQWGPWRIPGLLGIYNNTFHLHLSLGSNVLDFFAICYASNAGDYEIQCSLAFGGTLLFAIA